ncbi:PorP/SprF family type IX secretion system membrane protein [Maribacter sp. 2307ULW6-5]|uniref:PorP/SprF family type IX secretion system membrane protein n=1 Tax=Maribacter sp. 2307ULW6-5 TaxID=3386275 RepID=UPI0039BCC7E0
MIPTPFSPRFLVVSLLWINLCGLHQLLAQEVQPRPASSGSYHNQLFFNRFMIHPTFSLVRENKSYFNLLHRNQYAMFQDNSQNYFLGFSNRLNDRTAVGIGVYSQWSGVVQEFGFNANYATSVPLGEKSALAFGANLTYLNQGLDKNRVVGQENDPAIQAAGKESKIAVQPGMNLSLGRLDVGLYAQDLLRYNQTTNEFVVRPGLEGLRASVQYTHPFTAASGLFKDARIMPLLQLGRNDRGNLAFLGSLVLDLPHLGWVQTTLDDRHGLSGGLGVNLGQRMSLGYLMEKNLTGQEANLGWNHELSLGYTFKEQQTPSKGYVDSSTDSTIDRIVRNYEEQIAALIAEQQKDDGKRNHGEHTGLPGADASLDLAQQNRLILDELILRQDSMEQARTAAFEQKFETVVRMLRNDVRNGIKASLAGMEAQQGARLAVNTRETATKGDQPNQAKREYVKMPIKVLGQEDAIGVKPGYYVIANVYSNQRYLKAFMQDLADRGIAAREFYNRENGLHYVYLADYDHKEDAQTAFASHLNGRYKKEKWIMQVDHAYATASNDYEEDDY